MVSRKIIITCMAVVALLGAAAMFWLPVSEVRAAGTPDVARADVNDPGANAAPAPPGAPPISRAIASLPRSEAFRVAMTQLEVMGERSREAQRYILERGREAVPDLLAELRSIGARQKQLPVPAATDGGANSEYYRLEIRKFQIVALLGQVAGPEVGTDLIEVSRSSAPDSLVHQYVCVALRQIGNWSAARQLADQIVSNPSAPSFLVRQALSIHMLDPTPVAVAEAARRGQDNDPMVQDLALRVAARGGRADVLPSINKLLETPRRDSRDLSALMALAELRKPPSFARDLELLRKRNFVTSHLNHAESYNRFKWANESARAEMAPQLLFDSDTNLSLEGLRYFLNRGIESELLSQGIITRVDAASGKPSATGAALTVSPEWERLVAISGYGVDTAHGVVRTRKL